METNLMLLRFHPITPGDAEVNYRIYYSTREEELRKSGWTEEEKEKFVRMQFELQQKQYTSCYRGAAFNLILLGDATAGRLFIHETACEIRIMDIAILPEYRNKGIGTAVLNGIISTAEQKNKRASIHVEIYNPARRLYERLGFTISELRGMYYFMEYIPDAEKQGEESASSCL
jgi:ribosomal protein S18 acetylase RimI-like enzyme